MCKVRSLLGTALLECDAFVKGAFDLCRYRDNLRAFNGQKGRESLVSEILRSCNVEAVVETGTYLGGTTRWFARNWQVPMHTIESAGRYYFSNRLRFMFNRLVSVHRGDSRDVLCALTHDVAWPKTNVFFYLDAHWYADLPLLEELEIIATGFRNWIVMIDDFEVKDDGGYGYDDYGGDQRLTLRYLQSLSLPDTQVFWPSMPAAMETGAKRGCAVISHGMLSEILTGVNGLRPVELT